MVKNPQVQKIPVFYAGFLVSIVYGFWGWLGRVGLWLVYPLTLLPSQVYHLSGSLYAGSFCVSILYQCKFTRCARSSIWSASFIWLYSWYVILFGSISFGYRHNLLIRLWFIPEALESSRCVVRLCFKVWFNLFILYRCLWCCVLWCLFFSYLLPDNRLEFVRL